MDRTIVEIKNEYMSILLSILTPHIYDGIENIYKTAQQTEINLSNRSNSKKMELFDIFREYLKGIKTINNYNIETEAKRIKDKSKCGEWLDELVKAVIKSHIILYTMNNKSSEITNKNFQDSIDTKLFIHKCYIESARLFYNIPEIFWHGASHYEKTKNKREAHDMIKIAIKEAVIKMLPMKLILYEYLGKKTPLFNNKISESRNNISDDYKGGATPSVFVKKEDVHEQTHPKINENPSQKNIKTDMNGQNPPVINDEVKQPIANESKKYDNPFEIIDQDGKRKKKSGLSLQHIFQ